MKLEGSRDERSLRDGLVDDLRPLEALDLSTANLNNCIAFLKVSLSDAPEWFTDNTEGVAYGMNTLDVNLAPEVFKKANKLIESWQKRVRGIGESIESESANASQEING